MLMLTATLGHSEVLHTASVTLSFRADSIGIDSAFMLNRQALDSIQSIIDFYTGERRGLELRSVNVAGAASPEGGVWRNNYLSRERAKRIFSYVAQYAPLPDSITSISFLGRDYAGALRMVNADTATPSRSAVVQLLEQLIALKATNPTVKEEDALFGRLMSLDGSTPFTYMRRHHFPELRRSHITMTFAWPAPTCATCGVDASAPSALLPTAAPLSGPQPDILSRRLRNLPAADGLIALRTNLLHDLMLIPNIGVEVPLGKGWSAGAQWSYGWWTDMPRYDYYIHFYGGDINLRKYFASDGIHPLSGHHLGVYAQMYSYDYKLSSIGYWGVRWSLGAGAEYGYSIPLRPGLNLDLTAGAGYLSGIYNKYERKDGCDVWLATRRRRWIGPTKLEVSLVWLFTLPRSLQKGGMR